MSAIVNCRGVASNGRQCSSVCAVAAETGEESVTHQDKHAEGSGKDRSEQYISRNFGHNAHALATDIAPGIRHVGRGGRWVKQRRRATSGEKCEPGEREGCPGIGECDHSAMRCRSLKGPRRKEYCGGASRLQSRGEEEEGESQSPAWPFRNAQASRA